MKFTIEQICKMATEFTEAIPETMRAGQMPFTPTKAPNIDIINSDEEEYPTDVNEIFKVETLKSLRNLQHVIFALKSKIESDEDVKDYFPRIKKLILQAQEFYDSMI